MKIEREYRRPSKATEPGYPISMFLKITIESNDPVAAKLVSVDIETINELEKWEER